MATIYVDDRPCRVDPQQNLLHVCLSLGFNLPYFCWHPALGSVGACRQCAVKLFRDAHDRRGKLVMACMTPVADGARISLADPDALAFRAGIIEGMMHNHPHDCPVCDEGGECHLQDMTVMTGHDYRRYSFPKRTFRNQYLGPLVNHEMNRCIQCYRCVRFYREYAGGRDFNVFGIRNLVYFGRYQDGVLENEFAGNLDEVCPTGVFTDATHKRHYTRKWDLQFAPSICIHCGVGCNLSPGERYGLLRRIVNRYHQDLNSYFLCDRGRYGYEFVNSESRLRQARLGIAAGKWQSLAAQPAAAWLGKLLAAGDVIGIGSPRASLEANYALRLAVGPRRFFAGVSDVELRLLRLAADLLRRQPAPTLREMESADAVLVLGEDVTNTAPRMALSLRQAVRQQPLAELEPLKIPVWLDHAAREAAQERRGPFYIATPAATRLDDIAAETWHAAPGELARLGFAVARVLDESAPAVADLPPPVQALAGRIAAALSSARRPLVVSGLACRSAALLEASANIALALRRSRQDHARLAIAVPEANSLGLALLDPRPLSEAAGAEALIVLENDLYRRASASWVDELLAGERRLIALDCLEHPTTRRASLVLPAAAWSEDEGTFVNYEGRAQRYFAACPPPGEIQSSWRWLRDAMREAGREAAAGWQSLDDLLAGLARDLPALAPVLNAAPPADFRMAGARIPRQPHRYSGRTAILANLDVSEPPPPPDPDSPLAYSMEGNPDQPPAALLPFAWAPGWNSYQAWNKFQEEIYGPLRGGNPGVLLLAPEPRPAGDFFRNVPPPLAGRDGEWLLLPLYHIFGSEMLSRYAPAIRQLSPAPYLALSAADAGSLGLHAGENVALWLDGRAITLSLKIRPDLPPGCAGVPAGLEALPALELPAWSRIERGHG